MNAEQRVGSTTVIAVVRDGRIAMASDGPGIALAEIDVDRVEAVRKAMPVAKHRRL